MDPAAFHELALAEVDAIHRLAFHLCRSQHEAEDLVQETYLRALRSADAFIPGTYGIRPWLFKILHNVLHSRRSKDRRGREALRRRSLQLMEASSDGAGSPTLAELSPTTPPTASVETVNWDNMDERLYQAIHDLPIAHRTVFLLSAVEDLKYREIAQITGVPVGTVMSRLSRARSALAAQLKTLASEQNLHNARRVPQPNPAATRSQT